MHNNKSISKKQDKSKAPKTGIQKVLAGILALISIIIILVAGTIFVIGHGSFSSGISELTQPIHSAKAVKADMKKIIISLKKMDAATVDLSITELDEDISRLDQSLSSKIWDIASDAPIVGDDICSAKELVMIAQMASDEILKPLSSLMKEQPLSGLKVEVERAPEVIGVVLAYLDFTEQIIPKAEDIANRADGLELELIDRFADVSSYISTLNSALAVYHENGDAIPTAKAMLTSMRSLLEEYPVSEIGTDVKTLNYQYISEYLKYLIETMPEIDRLLEIANGIDISAYDKGGKVKEYLELANGFSKFYHKNEQQILNVQGALDDLTYMTEDFPLSEIQTEDGGIRADYLSAYLKLIMDVLPDVKPLAEGINSPEFAEIASSGKLADYVGKINKLMDVCSAYEEYLPLAMEILGNGGDRFYLIAAQNTAEIRASGGYPGSVGSFSIEDGVFRLHEFVGPKDILDAWTADVAEITEEEFLLSAERVSRMNHTRDAGFLPNYERVAELWALACEYSNRQHVDGVISVTPAILQDMLSVFGEVELSNGVVLNGENAIKYLQYDIYFEMAARELSNWQADDIFAECAEKTMTLITESLQPDEFNLDMLIELQPIIEEAFRDRVLMIWLEDEEAEEMVRARGWGGTLNDDENQPQIGIFFTDAYASKMGIFSEIHPEMGEAVVNEDGSRTYDISVTFENSITPEEKKRANNYILGKYCDGFIYSDFYIFAPAGGKIEDFTVSDGFTWHSGTYQNLEVCFVVFDKIYPGEPVTATCRITTAPGVDTQPVFVTTPTLQEYLSDRNR